MEKLPNEILCHIGVLSETEDLALLARLNHQFNKIFTPILYRRNITEDEPRNSCLLWAAGEGVLGTLKRALSFGANLDINGSKDEEEFCASPASVYSDVEFSVFRTPLHLAIEKGHHEIVKWLLENGATIDVPSKSYCFCEFRGITNRYSEDWYPLHTAICHSDEAMVKLLLDKGARLSAELYPGLHDAAGQGSVPLVDMFLKLPDFNPRKLSLHETTPLHHVSQCYDGKAGAQIVYKLARRGVPVNDDSHFGTALYMAVAHQLFEVAHALMDCGAVPERPPEVHYGMTILHRCLSPWDPGMSGEPDEKSTQDMLSRLVSTGMDLETQATVTREGMYGTPLYFAAALSKSPVLVEILLKGGASANGVLTSFSRGNRSLLGEIIRQSGDDMDLREWKLGESLIDIVCLMLKYGARIDPIQGFVESDLEYACKICVEGNSSLLELLCEKATEANVTLRHVKNLAREYQGRSAHSDLVKLIEKVEESMGE